MTGPLISILVPCYNTEYNLPFCLNSLINQTYRNIEIICVNDGSTDNTLNVLKKYSKSDSRIVIIDQKNSGVSAARNKAIDMAKGDYITFVDSDDFIALNFCERMIQLINDYSADIARARARGRVTSYDYKEPPLEAEPVISTRNTQEALEVYYDGKNYGWFAENAAYVFAALFKFETIKSLRFDESISFGEDDIFIQLAIGEADKIVYTDERLYFYYVSVSGLSYSGSKKEDLFLKSSIAMYKTQQQYFIQKGYINIQQLNLASACNSFCEIYRKSQNKEIKKTCKKEFNKYYKSLKKKSNAYRLFNLSPFLYQFIVNKKYPIN